MSELIVDKDSKLWKTAQEVTLPEAVEIKGKIPEWLNGSYLRVGPGKFDFDRDFSVNHWLDGFSIISKFDIVGKTGTVSFSSKYLESDCYKRAVKAQKPVVNEFGTRGSTEEGKSIFARIISTLVPEQSDNANVAFFTLRNQQKLFVTGESCFFHELDSSTLHPIEKFDTSKLLGLIICTAHPLTDESGDTYNIGTSVKTGLRYNIFKIPSQTSEMNSKDLVKCSKVICSINSRWSTLFSYTHSFGMTKNYIIFIEQPYVVNVSRLLASNVKNKGETIQDWLEWHPEYVNHFYIIDKNTGKIVNKSTEIVSKDPFFFLHFVNAYESEDGCQIVLDISVYDSPEIIAAQALTTLRTCGVGTTNGRDQDLNNQASCKRFIISLDNTLSKLTNSNQLNDKSLVLTPELIMKKGLEFPTINRQFQGKSYQFYYASGLTTQGCFKNMVCKIDVNKKLSTNWRESEHYIFGEPTFVNSPQTNSSDEDTGVLIVPMTDIRKEEPDMILFLDPKTMSEMGRAQFSKNIPCALHGIFVSSAADQL